MMHSTSDPSPLIGTWILTTSENFDAFLTDLGVNFVIRKMVQAMNVTLTIEYDEGSDTWHMTIVSVKTNKFSFKLNVPFEYVEGMGGNTTSTVTMENGVLNQTQLNSKVGKTMFIKRWIEGEQLIQEMNLENSIVKCRRIYKRKES